MILDDMSSGEGEICIQTLHPDEAANVWSTLGGESKPSMVYYSYRNQQKSPQ